jgi:hypothetical protein
MTRFATFTAAGAAALLLATTPASAQNDGATGQQQSRQQSRLDAILGALFGDRTGSTASIEAQWAAGRTPLATQRYQFESRVDADVRSGALSQSASVRLKSDYYELVELESRYGADGRFTAQERAELTERYGALTQVLVNGAYNDGENGYDNDSDPRTASVAEGQGEFFARVNAAVAARRITRTAGTRLRTDYAALVRTETAYLRDGRLTTRERDDLEAQLDALDARVGDVGYGGGVTASPRARLDAIARALPTSGLSASAQAQLRVEHGDLMRLEAAYARLTASADDRAYLDSRLSNLELRARVRR